MARISESQLGTTPFKRIIGHNSEIHDKWVALESDEEFKMFGSLFTEEELATLCAFIGFISGANKFGVMVGLSEKDLKQCDTR